MTSPCILVWNQLLNSPPRSQTRIYFPGVSNTMAADAMATKKPVHQQPWYWPVFTKCSGFSTRKNKSILFRIILIIDILSASYEIVFSEHHWISLKISQHQFRQWHGGVKQQAVTRAKVYIYDNMWWQWTHMGYLSKCHHFVRWCLLSWMILLNQWYVFRTRL